MSCLERNGLRLRYVRSSVVEMPYEELSGTPAVRAVLGALAAARDAPVPGDTVRSIFRDLSDLQAGASSLWHMVYCYGLVKFGFEREEYWELIREADPKAAEAEMATMLEQMMSEREARGVAIGEASGRAKMLLRRLRQCFGSVPAEVEAQVRAASVAELDAWFDACVDAPDLESVFKKSHMY